MRIAVAPVAPRRAGNPASEGQGVAVLKLAEQSTADRRIHLPLAGLLAVQILIGYEWFISGVTKVVRGGFPAGLADDLRDKTQGGYLSDTWTACYRQCSSFCSQ